MVVDWCPAVHDMSGVKAGLHYSEVKWSEVQNFVTIDR